jgi:type II secretory pathway pseudopilin PulG
MADERMHSACRWSRLRARLRRDSGFALIEVVVSAGLVMVIAAAVLGGIDIPSRISGENQAGSQAAALAQQDQERMRALPIQTLINYSNTATKTVDSHTYTVESHVSWVTDSGSQVTCASTDTTSGDYLKLSSTVSGGGQKRPVTIDSLLAPPNGSLTSTKGNLAVLVTNQLGDPSVGIPVSIPGKNGVTDADGCVFFALINPGQYTVTLGKAGWVDPGGNETVTKAATVSIGNTSTIQQSYAQAVTITANVEANVYGTVKASAIRSTGGISFTNAGLPPAGIKVVAPANGTTTSLSQNKLYPFTDGYALYSGTCTANNPVPTAGPFVANPAPGGSAAVTVRQAALNVTVTMPGGVTIANPKITVDNTTPGCPDFADLPLVNGKLVDSGVPGGTYNLCVEAQVNGSWYRVQKANVVVTNYANGTTYPIDAASSNPQNAQCANPVP